MIGDEMRSEAAQLKAFCLMLLLLFDLAA